MGHHLDADPTEPDNHRRPWLKWVLIGGIAALVLVVAGVFVYAKVINDSPDKLGTSDLTDALADPATTLASDPATTPSRGTDASSDSSADSSADSSTADSFDGDWVPTDASQFGYRVEEVLAGVNTTAVGRSNEIEGLLTIDGTTATAVDVTVQIENITSDDSRRDGKFTGSIMNAAEFPTATFTLTAPIEFGSIPTGDEQITATANGELTLRGVNNPVTFDVTAQTTGGRVGVLGSIPVLFSDYGIDNPSFGPVKTVDSGLVEFVLVFDRA